MITILPESCHSVIGLKIEGKLTHKAYQAILPKLEDAIQQHGSIQLLLEIHNFKGWQIKAAFDDLIFSFKNRRKIDRVAILCDGSRDFWTSLIDQPFAKGTKGREKYFKSSEKKAAWNWLTHKSNTIPDGQCVIEDHCSSALPPPAPNYRFLLVIGQSPLRFFVAGILDHWKALKRVDFGINHETSSIRSPQEFSLNQDAIQILKRLNWLSLLVRSKALLPSSNNQMILKTALFEKAIAKKLGLQDTPVKRIKHLAKQSTGWQAQFSKYSAKNYTHILLIDEGLLLNHVPENYDFSQMKIDNFSSKLIQLWDSMHFILRQP